MKKQETKTQRRAQRLIVCNIFYIECIMMPILMMTRYLDYSGYPDCLSGRLESIPVMPNLFIVRL